jgi:hypothetical protein
MANIPVVVIEVPPNSDAKVKVVEIMIEMKYFQAEEQKVLAKEFFPKEARLSSESYYCKKIKVS